MFITAVCFIFLIVPFSMKRENQSMVDKIPWDTWVVVLIFCVFKTEF